MVKSDGVLMVGSGFVDIRKPAGVQRVFSGFGGEDDKNLVRRGANY